MFFETHSVFTLKKSWYFIMWTQLNFWTELWTKSISERLNAERSPKNLNLNFLTELFSWTETSLANSLRGPWVSLKLVPPATLTVLWPDGLAAGKNIVTGEKPELKISFNLCHDFLLSPRTCDHAARDARLGGGGGGLLGPLKGFLEYHGAMLIRETFYSQNTQVQFSALCSLFHV